MTQRSPRQLEPVLYPNTYTWFVLVSSLDIMLTWVVLHYGGVEANPLAANVIYRWGLPGMVAYKFALILLVIVICEVVGRRNPKAGRGLALAAIGVTCIPLVIALTLVGGRLSWQYPRHLIRHEPPPRSTNTTPSETPAESPVEEPPSESPRDGASEATESPARR